MKPKLFIITLLALIVAGCTLEPMPEPEKEGGKMVTINAKVPSETRVAYNDDTRKLSWQIGDTLLLAGYDGTTYKGSNKFGYTGTGNTFQGIEVPGATNYKAYYPGEKITLDDNGNLQLADTFWQQTQTGNNSTAHLCKKMMLSDEVGHPYNQTFNLALKCSILKLALSGIPQEVGKLDQLIYTVEAAPGVLQSLPLNVTGVTFSATLDSLNAFLSFNPAVVPGIVANGQVKITLFGEQPYEWSTTVPSGKDYTAGNCYKGTVSSGWTEKVLINPLSYVAEYNVNPDGNGFVTDLTTCNVSGYFNWNDAVAQFTTKNIGGVNYHLPSKEEWFSIAPKYVEPPGYCVDFENPSSYDDITENVKVQSQNITMTSCFRNPGNHISYALRYMGTDMISAWKYEYISNGNNTHLKVTSRNIAPSVTIDSIANANFWTSGNGNDVVRYFPASGYKSSSGSPGLVAQHGYFWSSTAEGSSSSAWGVGIRPYSAYTYTGSKTLKFTIRLFRN